MCGMELNKTDFLENVTDISTWPDGTYYDLL